MGNMVGILLISAQDAIVGNFVSSAIASIASTVMYYLYWIKNRNPNIWTYIEDEQVGMIGLYGNGGIGKTALLTEVFNKLQNSTPMLFNFVFSIDVSKTPNLNEIQNKIGEKLEITDQEWGNKSQLVKAKDISYILQQMKYALLLDDLWEPINLINLGIPLPNQNNKSKVIFTTRSNDVCVNMQPQKQIKMQNLTWKKAWDLFQENVGEKTLNAHPDIPKFAKELAKECGGVPRTLVTVGQTMSRKTLPQEWNHGIELLKGYKAKNPDLWDQVFPLKNFSYDILPNVVQSCFLYCLLYPCNYPISKEEIIDKWICESFLDKFDQLHKVRKERQGCITTLVQAGLLEECSFETVKMSDVIRDMAINIASEGGEMAKYFIQVSANLKKLPDVLTWKCAERVSLMENYIREITGTYQNSNMLTLILNRCRLRVITEGFFQYMSNLRVLDLSNNNHFEKLPTDICDLASLQYLNLSNTSISEFPIGFEQLINLIYLNLESTHIKILPNGMLSSFKKLQILKLLRSRFSDSYLDVSKALISELESLEYLNELTITLNDTCDVSIFLCSNELKRNLKLLCLKDIKLLTRIDLISFSCLEEITNWKWTTSTYFQDLCSVFIVDCPMLKNLTLLSYAPKLEEVHVLFCPRMTELVGVENLIYGDRVKQVPFENLKTLRLKCLPQLTIINPIVLPFPRLKSLNVEGCLGLKKLPFNCSSCESGRGVKIWGEDEWWNGLEWDDETIQITFQSTFRSVS